MTALEVGLLSGYSISISIFCCGCAPCKGGAIPVGASPTRHHASAGSNRSNHGGNEMVEAFG
jgi:hypothetical protein